MFEVFNHILYSNLPIGRCQLFFNHGMTEAKVKIGGIETLSLSKLIPHLEAVAVPKTGLDFSKELSEFCADSG